MQRKFDRTACRRSAARRAAIDLAGLLWAAPLSLVGLLLAVPVALAGGRLIAVGAARHGVPALLVQGRLGDWLLARHPAGAMHGMAIGHVVFVNCRARSRRLLAHELMHVAQAARWGIFFPLMYVAASGLVVLRGGDAYWDNLFEVEARRAERHGT